MFGLNGSLQMIPKDDGIQRPLEREIAATSGITMPILVYKYLQILLVVPISVINPPTVNLLPPLSHCQELPLLYPLSLFVLHSLIHSLSTFVRNRSLHIFINSKFTPLPPHTSTTTALPSSKSPSASSRTLSE
mmetsp:Transcript_3323/g.7217  ORF Transcript_3323/g.7217 Transcript_3323/m.7217 type:complete len:133 (+) Transcript_3323:362-760(+)